MRDNTPASPGIPETIPLGSADILGDVLSQGEQRRHVSALQKYGVPVALAGLAAALGSKTGQAPEAVAMALSMYAKSAQETAMQARQMEMERAKLQMAQVGQRNQALQTIYPTLSPQGQAQAGGQLLGNVGINPQGYSLQNPEYERKRDIRTRERAAALDLSMKMYLDGVKDPRVAPKAYEGLGSVLGELGYGKAAENARAIGTMLTDSDRDTRQKLLSLIGGTALGKQLTRGENAQLLESLPMDYIDNVFKASMQSESNITSSKGAAEAQASSKPDLSGLVPGSSVTEKTAMARGIVANPGAYDPALVTAATNLLSVVSEGQAQKMIPAMEKAADDADKRAKAVFSQYSFQYKDDPDHIAWMKLSPEQKPAFEEQKKAEWRAQAIRSAVESGNLGQQELTNPDPLGLGR